MCSTLTLDDVVLIQHGYEFDRRALVLFSPRACAFHQKGASGGVTTRKIARYKYLGFKRYFKNYPPDGLLATVLLATLSRIMFCVQLSTSVFQQPKAANRLAHPTIPLPLISSHSQIMVLGGRCDLGEFLLTRSAPAGTISLLRADRLRNARSFLAFSGLIQNF